MDNSPAEGLYAKALAELILKYQKALPLTDIIQDMNSNALSLIEEIKDILDSEHLSDPECFYRIDEIVRAFYHNGIPTTRHWEIG